MRPLRLFSPSPPAHSITEVNSMTRRDKKTGRSPAAAAARYSSLRDRASGHGAEPLSFRWPDRLHRLPARRQWFLDVLRPTTITPQAAQPNLAPGQTFAKNQFVSGIEVTTVLDRNCGNQ
jgi:hypothetical protein